MQEDPGYNETKSKRLQKVIDFVQEKRSLFIEDLKNRENIDLVNEADKINLKQMEIAKQIQTMSDKEYLEYSSNYFNNLKEQTKNVENLTKEDKTNIAIDAMAFINAGEARIKNAIDIAKKNESQNNQNNDKVQDIMLKITNDLNNMPQKDRCKYFDKLIEDNYKEYQNNKVTKDSKEKFDNTSKVLIELTYKYPELKGNTDTDTKAKTPMAAYNQNADPVKEVTADVKKKQDLEADKALTLENTNIPKPTFTPGK